MNREQTLSGLLVVSLEQAVAAPYCSSRLADAGARVIKIERSEGDFARRYDACVKGASAYFVWLNRGKESVLFDLKDANDLAFLHRLLAQADVFIQNLAPGATERAGIGATASLVAGCAPNAAHIALAELALSGPAATTLVRWSRWFPATPSSTSEASGG